jgi:hypothetical protein
MQESKTIRQSASTSDNPDWVADQECTIATKEDVASSSDSDTGTDGSEHDDAMSNPMKQVDYEDEFGEGELEKLVKSEGPPEILQLILQEQADDFMNEDIAEEDHYADWIRWVADAEQSRHDVCTLDADVTLELSQSNPRDTPSIPTLRQVVQIKDDDSDRSTTTRLGSSNHEETGTRWRKICQRIRIDGNLDKRKQ